MGTALKANPFGGASHAKGIVLEKVYVFKVFLELLNELLDDVAEINSYYEYVLLFGVCKMKLLYLVCEAVSDIIPPIV